jgi:hypothetical protein
MRLGDPIRRVRSRLFYRRWMREKRRELATLPTGDAEPFSYTDADSEVLLVAFGGLDRQIGIPRFEFMRLTGETPVKKLFVRDPCQAWYHRGLPGYSETLEQTAAALAERTRGAGRLVVTGNSAGGYAALLFGSLLDADAVICFAPQTTLELEALHALGDSRWDDHLRPLFDAGAMDRRWLDLRALPANPRAHVYFDEDLEVDRLHAQRIEHLATLHAERGVGDHNLVKVMRDRGELAEVLGAALQTGELADTLNQRSEDQRIR